jgi:rubrerythrin
MVSSGARQWRVDCDCAPEVARQRHSQEWERMHSQVSKANAAYFIEEDRIDQDISEGELRKRVDQADGTIVVCNVCGTMREVEA